MVSKPRVTGDPLKGADYWKALEALRDVLADDLTNGPPGTRAQTAAQYRATVKELQGRPDVKKVSKADELADRRKARGAKTNARASAGGEGRK
jgi:hypothetical protein